jgi:hypothetical protein
VAFLAGKFARVTVDAVTATGPYRWGLGAKRERLDVTTFESTVGATGVNLHTDGLTGPMDTTISVEGWQNDVTPNLLFPDASAALGLFWRKAVQLGYTIGSADVLDYNSNTTVREKAGWTAQLQTNGLVAPAA